MSLERATTPPSPAIHQAAGVVKLDLKLCLSHPKTNRPEENVEESYPEAEWVLRWLVRRLNQQSQFRVEPDAYLLLRQLIDLIPHHLLVNLLPNYDILSILHSTLSDLEEIILTALGDPSFESLQSGSESSLTLTSSPTQAEPEKAKGTKRKRLSEVEDGVAMDVDEKQPLSSAGGLLTYLRVLDCLYCLVTIASSSPEEESSDSQLKNIVKLEPESGAAILSKAFRIAAVATTHFSQKSMTTDLQHLMHVLTGVLAFWELRSLSKVDLKILNQECTVSQHLILSSFQS